MSEINTADLVMIGKRIVQSAYTVHAQLGSGLQKTVYARCLIHELTKHGLKIEQQVQIPVRYDTLLIEDGVQLDLLVEKKVVIEMKTVEHLLSSHQAQVLTYLRLTHLNLGYLINFGEALIVNGIHRLIP